MNYSELPADAVTLQELSNKLNITYIAVEKRALRRNIEKRYCYKDGSRTRFFMPEDIPIIQEDRTHCTRVIPKGIKRKSRKKTDFWKVSEWNSILNCYIVKHCCLSKQKAYIIIRENKQFGIKSRMSPHITEKIKKFHIGEVYD